LSALATAFATRRCATASRGGRALIITARLRPRRPQTAGLNAAMATALTSVARKRSLLCQMAGAPMANAFARPGGQIRITVASSTATVLLSAAMAIALRSAATTACATMACALVISAGRVPAALRSALITVPTTQIIACVTWAGTARTVLKKWRPQATSIAPVMPLMQARATPPPLIAHVLPRAVSSI